MAHGQRYAVATMLSTNSLAATIVRLRMLSETGFPVDDAICFANTIDVHYRRRDGFVPRRVIALVNAR